MGTSHDESVQVEVCRLRAGRSQTRERGDRDVGVVGAHDLGDPGVAQPHALAAQGLGLGDVRVGLSLVRRGLATIFGQPPARSTRSVNPGGRSGLGVQIRQRFFRRSRTRSRKARQLPGDGNQAAMLASTGRIPVSRDLACWPSALPVMTTPRISRQKPARCAGMIDRAPERSSPTSQDARSIVSGSKTIGRYKLERKRPDSSNTTLQILSCRRRLVANDTCSRCHSTRR